jgi:hypothetical protein
MKVGDLVNSKGEKRTGVILREHVVSRCGRKEYSVKWFPRGHARVMAESLELLSKEAENERYASND